ncbi:Tim44 domain-containing protein [Muricoccus pecuniae]|uniref:Putative lipid-binding transport protein (Tim44 family) n=1 Tax=Muricoccus pecuniae TaxID=693023 RepID=A0A840YDM8_9PROT|nr:TIM44-like domain-containing protein [Roseomonas pecuniae]MBB5694251.1 putative lipid-binding transport protein (Tim44 family) [Roseomonas pecuniae]
MRRRARLLAAFATLALALGPAIAEARPGGGFSSGSRGSRTYSAPPSTRAAPGTATPFNRSEAPRQAPGTTAPGYAQPRPAPSYTTPNRGGMFGGGFMSGLMGGLLGAGLVGMLFGSGAFGGMSGGAGFLGFLLQLGIIAGLIWLVLRVLRNRRAAPVGQPAMAGAGAGGPMGGPASGRFAREMDGTAGGGGAGRVAAQPIQVGQADFSAFEQSLVRINEAWSRRDMAALGRLTTPEMARYFQGDLRDLEARGWQNETRDVRLEAGDLSEAWAEGGLEYATVAMRFSLVDVTRDARGQVVEGDPNARQTTTEVWTFVRRPREPWLLSAIQQTG